MSNVEFLLAHSVLSQNASDNEHYLAHYGTQGMKWGQRKYRNEDGTLTEAGKERYRYEKESSQNISRTGQEVAKSIKSAKESLPSDRSKVIRKDYSDIPSKELENRIRRLELEHKYGDLSGDTKYVKSGGEKLKDILGIVGSVVAIGASALMIRSLMYDNTIKKSNAINAMNKAEKEKKKD